LFGCCFALCRRPGEIHVCLIVACPLRFACLSCTALDASGTLMASIATSAVIAPRPPFPQSALDRDSPPRLPVPHSALERVSPRLPPFIRTFRSPFRALARAAWFACSAAHARRLAAAKSGRNLRWIGVSSHPPAGGRPSN